MRLLDKKTIAKDVASQRRVQIDEGIALATKVDKLRQTHSSLESQYHNYASQLSEELKTTLRGLEEGIVAKKKELVAIEEERQRLLEPLTQKQAEISEKEENLSLLQEEMYGKRASLTLFSQELDERSNKVIEDETFIADMKKQLNVQIKKVAQSSIDAQDMLLAAQTEKKKILDKVNAKLNKAEQDDERLAIWERELKIKENNLTREEENIINIKIQLADQRKTLERALKRK